MSELIPTSEVGKGVFRDPDVCVSGPAHTRFNEGSIINTNMAEI